MIPLDFRPAGAFAKARSPFFLESGMIQADRNPLELPAFLILRMGTVYGAGETEIEAWVNAQFHADEEGITVADAECFPYALALDRLEKVSGPQAKAARQLYWIPKTSFRSAPASSWAALT